MMRRVTYLLNVKLYVKIEISVLIATETAVPSNEICL